MYNFQLGKVYSFNVYPVALLGNNFDNVTVMALMDQKTANRDIDTQALHIQVYPYLPAGTPNDPSATSYLKLRTTAGNETIVANTWIKEDTIEVVESRTITVVIGDVTASDVNRIRNALVANNFNNLEISIS